MSNLKEKNDSKGRNIVLYKWDHILQSPWPLRGLEAAAEKSGVLAVAPVFTATQAGQEQWSLLTF